jgi:hypothetical protein
MKKKRAKKFQKGHVTIKKGSKYGPALYGVQIYFEGGRPPGLNKDGKINFGKHILETLQAKFGSGFRFVITKQGDSIKVKRGIHSVRISQTLLARMNSESFSKTRDIKLDIVRNVFARAFPEHFKDGSARAYVAGTLARVLDGTRVSKMSSEDKDAVKKMLPDFVAAESIKSVNLLKATAQIKSLREVETELREALKQKHAESWWQTYIQERILIIQQGYIQAIDKLNVAIGTTKFPDFLLVTHDGYIDVLEIKKPDTPLLRHDENRDNYYWDAEMAKAISQTENYVAIVEKESNSLRSHLKDKYKLELQVLRPRGIILAGNAQNFDPQKQKDDYRLLSHGLKHVTLVTYDELLTRLTNYIHVLESHVSNKVPKK